MPYIQTFFELIIKFIAVISTFYFVTFVYLAYTNPTGLEEFVMHTYILFDELGSFLRIFATPLPF